MARTGNTVPRDDQIAPNSDIPARHGDRVAQRRAHEWAKQQQAIASLGQAALTSPDVDSLLSEAARRIAQTLGVDCVAAFELQPDRQGLLLRAGVGWRDGCVGNAVVGMSTNSPAGFAVL